MTKKQNQNSHDEREALLGFLQSQREGLRLSVYGLTDEEAKQAPSASTLSLAGLIKHVASVERNWIDILQQAPANDQAAYLESFQPGGQTLEAILADFEKAAEATDAAFLDLPDLEYSVPVPKEVPWFPKDIDAWTARWVLVHLIEEAARHAGHADIVRESLDGAQAVALRAAAEGWPENGFVKPWRRNEEG